jgi:hypothetical protein
MKLAEEAEECFRKVISLQKDLKDDTWLPPYATYELGILHSTEGRNEKAIVSLENAKYVKSHLSSAVHHIRPMSHDLRHSAD